MGYFSLLLAFLLVVNNAEMMMVNESSDDFIIGVLMDDNYGRIESLETFIYKQICHTSLHIGINFSDILLNKTGGLLKNVEYFKGNKANVIVDLQRHNNEAEMLGEYLKVPVITMAPRSKPQRTFTISMYPSIKDINSAIVDCLLRYKIAEAFLLFDKRRSRQAMNLHTKSQKQYIKMEMMPELRLDDMEMIKQVIRMAWETQIKTVVLLCDTEDIKTVVKATLQSRLYDRDRQEWKWIVSDMDFQIPDYEPLEGFVGFSLPEPTGKSKDLIDFRESLVKDAFKDKIFSNVFYASVIDAIRLISEAALLLKKADKRQITGTTVLEALRNVTLPLCNSNQVKNCGLTSEIKFDASGVRKVDDLDFVIITEEHKLLRKWKWNSEPRKSHFPKAEKMNWVGDVVEDYICYETRDKKPMKKQKNNFTIMVLKSDPPFVFVNQSKSSPDNFKGFIIDIVRELATRLDFEYNIVVLEKGGSKGFVKALTKKKVDIAVGSFTITAEREKDIDFSKPFMDFRAALILQIPEEQESLFNFHKPFSGYIWLMVVLTVFAMTFLLYCVDYYSPIGYRKTAENAGEGEEFNLMNSLWFATASMLQQGGDDTPKAPSGRILASAFWFFILIIISTYTANLAAFFTNKKIESPINNLEDLVYKSGIDYGVLNDGQLYHFLRSSKAAIHTKMFSHMRVERTVAKSSADGVKKAREGRYAYISEKPILEYYNNKKPCNTMLVKNLLEVKSYGFGLPLNSENTNALSVAILKLREEGFIERRRKFWWEEKSECIANKPVSATVTLELHSLGGVFIVMIGGSVISFILLAIEIKFKWIIDLIMRAQENNAGNEAEQRNETVMRVEISQGERTLNPINHTEPPRKRWFPALGFGRAQ